MAASLNMTPEEKTEWVFQRRGTPLLPPCQSNEQLVRSFFSRASGFFGEIWPDDRIGVLG